MCRARCPHDDHRTRNTQEQQYRAARLQTLGKKGAPLETGAAKFVSPAKTGREPAAERGGCTPQSLLFVTNLLPSLDGQQLVDDDAELVEGQHGLEDVLIGPRHRTLVGLKVELGQSAVLLEPAASRTRCQSGGARGWGGSVAKRSAVRRKAAFKSKSRQTQALNRAPGTIQCTRQLDYSVGAKRFHRPHIG